MYDPFSNKCIGLTNENITITNIDSILYKTVEKSFGTSKRTKKSYNSNIRCHHGKMNEMNTSCVCDVGWVSAVNDNFPIVTTIPVHKCTVKMYSKSLCSNLPAVDKIDNKNLVSFTCRKSMDYYIIYQNNNILLLNNKHKFYIGQLCSKLKLFPITLFLWFYKLQLWKFQ